MSVLAAIEKRCQRPIASLFDLIVGTSTGGILALGLTAPGQNAQPRNDAASLLTLYGSHGDVIFPGGGSSTWKQRIFGTNDLREWKRPDRVLNRGAQKAGAPFGGNPMYAGGARYFGSGLEETLDAQIGETLISSALTRVLVTSYDMAYGEPVLFSSFNWPPGAVVGTPMRIAARATSAGPTFFEPVELTVGDRRRVLVDGGVAANDPSLIAHALGGVLATEAGKPLFLLSLGTGVRNPAQPKTLSQVKAANWLEQARNVFEAAMSGSGEIAEFVLPTLMNLPDMPVRYIRLQTVVGQCSFAMDDSSPANTQCLAALANQMVVQESEKIEYASALILQG